MSRALGVALSPEALVAAGASGEGPRVHRLTSSSPQAGWSDLAPVLEEVRRAFAPNVATLHVALLPPLVQLRRIELPRLTEDEVRAVLTRDAHRYLLEPPAAPLVAAWPPRPGRKSPKPYLAAFADADLVAAVHAAAVLAGFRSVLVLPAHVAWEAGARRFAPDVRQGRGRLVVADEQVAEALIFDAGRIQLGRRAATAEDAALLGGGADVPEPAEEPAWVALVAPEAVREPIEASLRACGLALLGGFGEPPLRTPAELAIAGAPLARAGELVPQPVRLERWRREARLSHRLLAGAAAMLLLSAAAELWGAYRELAALQAERRGLAPVVAQAMDLRQTVDGVHERLRALAAAEAGASRWTAVIASVAEHLPSDAHLLNLRGDGDSLVLEGVASRAAGAFESLRAAPGVLGVRAEAPIRQEAQDSAAPVERFTLGARLSASLPVEGRP